jgi:tyrosine-protein phosphatase YwqE
MEGQWENMPIRITTPHHYKVDKFDSPHQKQKKYFESLKKKNNTNDITIQIGQGNIQSFANFDPVI